MNGPPSPWKSQVYGDNSPSCGGCCYCQSLFKYQATGCGPPPPATVMRKSQIELNFVTAAQTLRQQQQCHGFVSIIIIIWSQRPLATGPEHSLTWCEVTVARPSSLPPGGGVMVISNKSRDEANTPPTPTQGGFLEKCGNSFVFILPLSHPMTPQCIGALL